MLQATVTFLSLVAVLAAAPVGPATAQSPVPASWGDETMEFTVRYLGLPAGKARISVGRREGALLPVFLEARTAGVGAVVDFRQQLASYLDVTSGLPRSSSMLTVETSYRRTVTTRYDRELGLATVRTRGRSERVRELPVPEGALDFVALVFRLRALPLEPGASHTFHVLSGTRLTKIVVGVEGRERVETPAGTFPAVKVRVPTGFGGRFSEKKPTYVWFSDDARRAIVRLETDFAVGDAIAELVTYRGSAR